MTTNARSKTITVDALARVEGEGGLTVQVRGGKVTDVKLRIYEPPRFFKAFLRGRDFVVPEDVKAVGQDVLRHRVAITYEAEAEGKKSEDVIERILAGVLVP